MEIDNFYFKRVFLLFVGFFLLCYFGIIGICIIFLFNLYCLNSYNVIEIDDVFLDINSKFGDYFGVVILYIKFGELDFL